MLQGFKLRISIVLAKDHPNKIDRLPLPFGLVKIVLFRRRLPLKFKKLSKIVILLESRIEQMFKSRI